MKFRMVPANGVPITTGMLFKVIGSWLLKRNRIPQFELDFTKYIGLPYCTPVWSGRAALYVALLALKKVRPEKTEVLIPVLTCESVYYAVKRAGLQPVLYDIDPETLGSSADVLQQKITGNTLCVVASSLFGITVDMEQISKIVKAHGCFLVEDVAQSLGAQWQGKKLGTFGDISIFSFGKSKNITTMQGGMICTGSDALKKEIKYIIDGLPQPTAYQNWKLFVLFKINYLVVRPFVFNIVTALRLPFADLCFSEDFPVLKMGSFQKMVGMFMLKELAKFTDIRRANARAILAGLRESAAIELLGGYEVAGGKSVFLRLPVLAEDVAAKASLVQRLNAQGIWAGSSMYHPLYRLTREPAEHYPMAARLHDKIVLLPTHPYLRKSECDKMAG